MLKRIVIVGFITSLGVGGVAAPAFANDGGSATVCDTVLASVEPGGCVSAAEWGPRVVEFPFVSSGICTGDQPLVPTVTEFCVDAEIDSPSPIGAQSS